MREKHLVSTHDAFRSNKRRLLPLELLNAVYQDNDISPHNPNSETVRKVPFLSLISGCAPVSCPNRTEPWARARLAWVNDSARTWERRGRRECYRLCTGRCRLYWRGCVCVCVCVCVWEREREREREGRGGSVCVCVCVWEREREREREKENVCVSRCFVGLARAGGAAAPPRGQKRNTLSIFATIARCSRLVLHNIPETIGYIVIVWGPGLRGVMPIESEGARISQTARPKQTLLRILLPLKEQIEIAV